MGILGQVGSRRRCKCNPNLQTATANLTWPTALRLVGRGRDELQFVPSARCSSRRMQRSARSEINRACCASSGRCVSGGHLASARTGVAHLFCHSDRRAGEWQIGACSPPKVCITFSSNCRPTRALRCAGAKSTGSWRNRIEIPHRLITICGRRTICAPYLLERHDTCECATITTNLSIR